MRRLAWLFLALTKSADASGDADSAACYAERYADVKSRLCPRGNCLRRARELQRHYATNGAAEGRTWGCELPGGGGGKALVALYGLHNRSAGCAWHAQKANIVAPLEALNYSVDVWDATLVRGEPRGACPFSQCFGERQAVAEAAVVDLCRKFPCQIRRPEYRGWGTDRSGDGLKLGSRERNVWRAFFHEYALARRLKGVEYDVVVAVGEDVAPLFPLTATDLYYARQPRTVVASCSWNYHGWTNGYYAGTPATVSKLMAGFAALPEMLTKPTQLNFEGLVRAHALKAGVKRRCPQRDIGRANALNCQIGMNGRPCFLLKIRHSGQVVAPGGGTPSSYAPWPPEVHACLAASRKRVYRAQGAKRRAGPGRGRPGRPGKG